MDHKPPLRQGKKYFAILLIGRPISKHLGRISTPNAS